MHALGLVRMRAVQAGFWDGEVAAALVRARVSPADLAVLAAGPLPLADVPRRSHMHWLPSAPLVVRGAAGADSWHLKRFESRTPMDRQLRARTPLATRTPTQ